MLVDASMVPAVVVAWTLTSDALVDWSSDREVDVCFPVGETLSGVDVFSCSGVDFIVGVVIAGVLSAERLGVSVSLVFWVVVILCFGVVMGILVVEIVVAFVEGSIGKGQTPLLHLPL